MRQFNHRLRSSSAPLSAYLTAGLAMVAAGVLLVRSMPDLVRYLRIRRM